MMLLSFKHVEFLVRIVTEIG